VTEIKVDDAAALVLIEKIAKRVAAGFGEEFGEALEGGRRTAVSLSPVVTGSYAGSHRITVDADRAGLGINPDARNTATGTPVTDYAGAVEDRHHVYERVLREVPRLVTRAAELSLRQIV